MMRIEITTRLMSFPPQLFAYTYRIVIANFHQLKGQGNGIFVLLNTEQYDKYLS